MAKYFTPPTYAGVPTVDMDTPPAVARLYRHMQARPIGYAVFKRSDGTYYQTAGPTQADETNAVANNVPGAKGNIAEYLGGHSYLVDDTEAAALTTAGFGAYLTDTPP